MSAAGENGIDAARVSWRSVLAWTGLGVVLLCVAAGLQGLWGWTGVSIDILVHVGGTLLLAPLLPFLERSVTRRVVQANKRMVQQETAGLREQVGSLATRIDQLQAIVEHQDAEDVQEQDRIIEALSNEVSSMNVARAMTVANIVGALPDGELTVSASAEPRIDLTFSWQYHIGDGRFSEPSGNFLGVRAQVDADPRGGGTPVIQTIWKTTEKTETMIGRISDQLRDRDRWNGPSTIDWSRVFRDLHHAIVLAVAYKRRDTDVPWRLHGGLYELHGEDWAITEAGIEYRPAGQVVLAEEDFPEVGERRAMTASDLGNWAPLAPEGADLAEWRHALWRGLWHFPVHRGPVRGQPSRYPCKTMPTLPNSSAAATR
jgi:hypothetical protein